MKRKSPLLDMSRRPAREPMLNPPNDLTCEGHRSLRIKVRRLLAFRIHTQ